MMGQLSLDIGYFVKAHSHFENANKLIKEQKSENMKKWNAISSQSIAMNEEKELQMYEIESANDELYFKEMNNIFYLMLINIYLKNMQGFFTYYETIQDLMSQKPGFSFLFSLFIFFVCLFVFFFTKSLYLLEIGAEKQCCEIA